MGVLRGDPSLLAEEDRDVPGSDHLSFPGLASDSLDLILTFYAVKSLELPLSDMGSATPSRSLCCVYMCTEHIAWWGRFIAQQACARPKVDKLHHWIYVMSHSCQDLSTYSIHVLQYKQSVLHMYLLSQHMQYIRTYYAYFLCVLPIRHVLYCRYVCGLVQNAFIV